MEGKKMELCTGPGGFYIRRPFSGNKYDKRFRKHGVPAFEYFGGYDAMGSAEWLLLGYDDEIINRCGMDPESAKMTLRDLEDAE